MNRLDTITILAMTAALAACGTVEPTDPIRDTTVDTSAIDNLAIATDAGAVDSVITPVQPIDTTDWVGRWTGVEGMYLDIQPDPARGEGTYLLEMQYSLDDQGVFDGDATTSGIRFTRPDGTFLLTPTDGDATGLRNLFGKQDCLTVTAGEGYCRD